MKKAKVIFAVCFFVLALPLMLLTTGGDTNCSCGGCGECETTYNGSCVSCSAMNVYEPENHWTCVDGECVTSAYARPAGN